MKNSTLTTWRFSCGLILAASMAAPLVQANEWFISVGPYVRQDMEMSIIGSSETQMGNFHAATPFFRPAEDSVLGNRGFESPRPGTGVLPTRGFADRPFDDGFVNIGSTTGVEGSLAPDYTWYYGYGNASQHNASANTLTFNKTVQSGVKRGSIVDRNMESRRSVRTTLDTGFDERIDDIDGEGLEIVLGRHLKTSQDGRWSLAAVLGGNGIDIDRQHVQAETFREEVTTRKYEVTTTHQFSDSFTAKDEYAYRLLDPSGGAITPRAAGDAGTFNGLPLPSPLIPNVPESHRRTSETSQRQSSSRTTREQVSADRFEAYNTVDFDVDADVFQLWGGPQFSGSWKGFSGYVRPKLSLNLIELDVRRQETFMTERGQVLQSWSESADDQVWSFGYGVIGGLQVIIHDSWYLAFEVGIDEIEDKAEVQIGPNQLEFDASGESGSVRLGTSF